MIRLGTAPVSFGVFGTAAAGEVSPGELLEAMATAGYAGGELGPPGFFGTPTETARAFADAGLDIIGAYVPLHLAQPEEVWRRDLDSMRRTLDELAAADGADALAILADEGDDALIRNPFRDNGDRSRGLDERGWARAAERLTAARALAAEWGVGTSFHPHFATYVEQAWEIDTLMDRTDVDLCLDTGHFHLGHADSAAYARRYRDRLNHVHVKDVRDRVLDHARAERRTDFEEWWEGLAAPLGSGDVSLTPFLAELAASGYTGWVVVEQDRGPVDRATFPAAVRDQVANLQWLRERIGDGGGRR